jgi:hypothetical protein
MKYEVIRRFRDKYTREIILPGATFICDEADRIKDLVSRGIIKTQDLNPDEMTKKEIMSMLDDKGIEYNPRQTKTELVKLLGGD